MSDSASQHNSAIEQRISELAQQSRVLESYMNDITSRQVAVSRLLDEARTASTTIQGITSESDSETLMPIGVGLYLKTIVPPVKKIVVNLGSGVSVEKSREDALNFVEARIKEYEVALRQFEAQRQEIAMHMEQLQEQVNQMLGSAQRSNVQ
ncbi:MAG: prefoldin subunit alpha [Nitrososphaera sp.]|jgi:prefoldin alpha subunit|nr:prefoldin subunit alpha [Nitrososphaera sp.]